MPDDEEIRHVLVGVTARESDALEHLHLLLWGQRRYKLADAIGGVLLHIRERQAEALRRRRSRKGSRPRPRLTPQEDLRPGPWAEE